MRTARERQDLLSSELARKWKRLMLCIRIFCEPIALDKHKIFQPDKLGDVVKDPPKNKAGQGDQQHNDINHPIFCFKKKERLKKLRRSDADSKLLVPSPKRSTRGIQNGNQMTAGYGS